MRKYFLILLTASMLLSGCFTASNLNIQNLSFLYNKQMGFSNTESLVWHKNPNFSVIYYTLDLHDFLYERPTPFESPTAEFSVSYELYHSYESDIIIDSLTLFFSDSLYFHKKKRIIESFTIPVKYPENYLLKLIITDLNKKESANAFVNIYKNNKYSSQNFLLQKSDDLPLFKKYFTENQSISIKLNDASVSSLFVRFYHRDFPIASPPFVMDDDYPFNYIADSIFMIDITAGETRELKFDKQGFYHIQIDTNRRAGLTLYHFYDDFPNLTSSLQILNPIRYLTTKKEFNKLSSVENIKIAVDSFWIENSGNPERARAQISRYYNRVRDANVYFTSYLEGWKSDRGIVYIIYGPPNIVYRSSDVETWIYGEEGNFLSIKFNFAKVINPFTDNDYLLTKSPTYKEGWYNAVANWRR